MNSIIKLQQALSDPDFFAKQFSEHGTDKNILFINPQLSGKHLYKTILPYFVMYSQQPGQGVKVATAIQHLSKYDPMGQLFGGKEVDIPNYMIKWANFIVFPFTTQPLVAEIYENIRKVNPTAKIAYQVDFNFYELSQKHPYAEIFNEPSVVTAVEDNMLFADTILVSNKEFSIHLYAKLKSIIPEKYQNQPIKAGIRVMPFLIDTQIVLGNMDQIEYSVQGLTPVKSHHTQDIQERMEQIEEVAAEVKEKGIEAKEQKTQEVIEKIAKSKGKKSQPTNKGKTSKEKTKIVKLTPKPNSKKNAATSSATRAKSSGKRK